MGREIRIDKRAECGYTYPVRQKHHQFNLRMSDDEWKLVTAIAKQEHISKSKLIINALREHHLNSRRVAHLKRNRPTSNR